MHPRAQQLIEQLRLEPHPEGGFFREVYRGELPVHSDVVGELRAAMTDIYFLLPSGQVSRWHRVAHDELWNFYEGAPLRLYQLNNDLTERHDCCLDPNSGRFKHLVPGGYWQAAATTGDYSLVGCTVTPGFDFRDFRMMQDCLESIETLKIKYTDLVRFV